MSPYNHLEDHFARIGNLDDAVGLLHWDMSTIMPKGGAGARAEQMATLRRLRHSLVAAPEVADLLNEAEANNNLAPWQEANLAEMRRAQIHASAVEGKLIEALSKACAACEMIWREARPAADFARVRPALTEILRLGREVAAAKAEILECSPYEALLDEWEPGGRTHAIDPVFDDLANFLPDFTDQVLEAQAKSPPARLPKGPFPAEKQRMLGEKLMAKLGFDFERGRLDQSHHPFCGGATDDVRITTRYDENDFVEGLMAILHETGHALYEFGLPKDWQRQPVGRARGMAMHESQSLLIEMQACRTKEFMMYAAPLMRKAFGGRGPDWGASNLHRLYTRVQRSFIRTEADEVTYPAHVILRYRLEKAMVVGDLEIADLPGAFNDGLEALLGIRPPDDAKGCLQDIHWYAGAWGYFPTYTLGAIAAAQLFEAAKKANPEILPSIGRGDFAPLLTWLRTNIHSKGSLQSMPDLLVAATGRKLDPETYKSHLKERYLNT